MHNNLDLQLRYHQTSAMDKDPRSGFRPANEDAREWISAFNTSILTTRANELKERPQELSALMQTPEFTSLIIGAQHLADSLGITKEEATERLIETFRKMDTAWNQLVLKRGIQAMID
jgi:hypothetical protein